MISKLSIESHKWNLSISYDTANARTSNTITDPMDISTIESRTANFKTATLDTTIGTAYRATEIPKETQARIKGVIKQKEKDAEMVRYEKFSLQGPVR